MSDHTDTLGGRLPLVDPAAVNPSQREIFDRMATRIVPWANDAQFQSIAAEQMHTSLSARVREVVILAVGAVWQADYELYAHLAVARKAGLSEEAARAVATGEIPEDLRDNEKIAMRLTQQLSTSHRVDESLYREAENRFGTKGLIDIAFLIGIYHSVCATLTMFAIPAPE